MVAYSYSECSRTIFTLCKGTLPGEDANIAKMGSHAFVRRDLEC